VSLSANQEQLLVCLRQVALEAGDSGRALTSLIGELSACKILDLVWQPSQGFDAVGGNGERFQIKSRKSWATEEVRRSARLGRFGKKREYNFDTGIFVEFNSSWEVVGIWQLSREYIEILESKEAKGGGLHIRDFGQAANKVYPAV
jgi:hypothetical protein